MLALHEVSQLEGVLAQLREAGIKVEDMQLIEADLEDVFMEIVRQ
jgi:ABC-2 type transport system ATP-binding protein